MGLVYLCVVTIKVVLLFAGYEYIVAIKVSIETRYRKTLVMSGKRWILSPGRCYTTLTHSHTTVYIEEILHRHQTSYTNIFLCPFKKRSGWVGRLADLWVSWWVGVQAARCFCSQ